MAEIHALLYITGRPMNTDEIMERLSISRGNTSMSLRSLVEWAIVTRTHRRGDRKEYFEADQDPWALSRKVIRERLRRELHPVLTSLYEVREATLNAQPSAPVEEHNQRLDSLLDMVQTMDRLAEGFGGAGPEARRECALQASVAPCCFAPDHHQRGRTP